MIFSLKLPLISYEPACARVSTYRKNRIAQIDYVLPLSGVIESTRLCNRPKPTSANINTHLFEHPRARWIEHPTPESAADKRVLCCRAPPASRNLWMYIRDTHVLRVSRLPRHYSSRAPSVHYSARHRLAKQPSPVAGLAGAFRVRALTWLTSLVLSSHVFFSSSSFSHSHRCCAAAARVHAKPRPPLTVTGISLSGLAGEKRTRSQLTPCRALGMSSFL